MDEIGRDRCCCCVDVHTYYCTLLRSCCAGSVVDVAARSKRVELAAQATQRAARECVSDGPRHPSPLSQSEAAALMSAPGREPEVRARLIEELTWLQGLMNANNAVGDGTRDGAGIERGGYLLGGDQPTVWFFLSLSLFI